MRLFLYLIVSLLIFTPEGTGSEIINKVNIRGHAPGYAGDQLVFYRWTDQVSFTRRELFRFEVDRNEEFSLDIEISDGPLYIFSNAGVYYLYMYIEPGKEYQVVLPEKTEKSPRDKLNPYYEGISTHMAVINYDSTELNALIRNFDVMYEPLFGETFIKLAVDRDHQVLDSIQGIFNRRFADAGHPYFDIYRRYKIALLKIMTQMQSVRSISDNYFLNEPVHYNNVAYMELFNQVYNDYFLFFSGTAGGRRIFDDIRKRSYADLKSTLRGEKLQDKESLLEMLILKGLHDAFYGSDFSREDLLAVLDSLAATSGYPEHVRISGNIRDKVTRLLKGSDPPDFELMDREGEMVGLSDYRDNYVYLNFCTAAGYSCLSEYPLLSHLKENHGEYLRIVTIFVDEDYQSMLDFLTANDYEWDFLFYGHQPSILRDYNIRVFPGYYLIDRDGTLLMSPAPSPAENFERYLMNIMRSRGEIR